MSAESDTSRFDLRTCFRSALVIGMWMLVVLVAFPRVKQAIGDVQGELPPLNRTVLGWSSMIASGGWIGMLALPLVLGWTVAQLPKAARPAARIIIIVGLGALTLITILGLFLAMLSIAEGLQTGISRA